MDVDPFDNSFADAGLADDEEEEEIDDGIDWEPPQPQQSHFAVLPSSLPNGLFTPKLTVHKRPSPSGREKRHRNPRWHFGIRSRSPRMEVMLEIYRTLQALGMEWKEKKTLGGLGGLWTNTEKLRIERRQEKDGPTWDSPIDSKAASSVYFVETRARVEDIVVRGANFSYFRKDLTHWCILFEGPDGSSIVPNRR